MVQQLLCAQPLERVGIIQNAYHPSSWILSASRTAALGKLILSQIYPNIKGPTMCQKSWGFYEI